MLPLYDISIVHYTVYIKKLIALDYLAVNRNRSITLLKMYKQIYVNNHVFIHL